MSSPDNTNPYQPPDTPGQPKPLVTIVLGAVLLLAIFITLAFVAPGLAILFGVFALPMAIRAAALYGVRRPDGSSLGAPGLLAIAFGSLALFVTAATAGCIAFAGICFPTAVATESVGGNMEMTIWLAFLMGGIAGVGAAGLVLWKLWDLPLWMAGVKSSTHAPIDTEIVD